jgi:mannan endo-1,4-beta-mannosidase
MVSRRKLLKLGLGTTVGLAGCSGISGDSEEPTESATDTATATKTPTATGTATETPTEEPTETSTEEPTDTPTEEPTEEPAQSANPLPFTDTAASLDTLHSQSETDNLSLDTSNSKYFSRPADATESTDSSRFTRSDSTDDTDLVYAFSEPAGWVSAEVHNVNNKAGSVSMYTSSDGENWSEVDYETDDYYVPEGEGGWNDSEITAEFGDGIRYVKFVLTGSDVVWNPQLGHVEARAGKPAEPTPSNDQSGDYDMTLESESVAPELNEAGRNVLGFLQNLPGNGWLSGQHEYDPYSAGRLDYVESVTGKHPGLVGWDIGFGGLDKRADVITSSWNDSNQLTTISWHVSAPPIESTEFENSKKSSDIDAVLTDGTEENEVYMRKLKNVADFFEELDNSSVPILWRPFHEADGGWFWWGMEGASQFKRLWEHMFEYLHDERGLTNLVWVWSGSHNKPNSSWYPGDEYVDIAGMDTYKSHRLLSWDSQWGNMNNYVTNRPVALTETDSIPSISSVSSESLPFLWFLLWHGEHLRSVDKDYLRSIYENAFTINREDLPEF